MPGQNRPGMGTNTGPAGKGKIVPGMATGVPKGAVPELKIDPVTLPEGYSPPADRNPMMDDEVLLVPADELTKLSKDVPKYQTLLRTARGADADKVLIRAGIRYRLAQMCLKQNRQNLSKLHDDLLRELNGAASAPDNQKTIKEFRQMVMQEFLNQAAPLLDNQNYYVRLHVAILLGQLDVTEENPKFNLKQEAFAPSIVPLVKLITNPAQPQSLKVPATNGLVRILRLGTPNVVLRTQVATALTSELQNKKADPWYQMRLAGALGNVDVELDQQQTPFVVNSLRQVVTDDEREFSVRSEAAYSLGRVPLPAACNPPTVLKDLGVFALKLAKAAQQQPPQGASDPKWRAEFIKLYLAFQQYDKDDLMADKRNKAGLLNNSIVQAKPLYNVIVPMTAAIIHGQRLTVQQVQSLEEFVSGSAGGAATPASQPTTQQQPNRPKSEPVSVKPEAKATSGQ